MVEKFNILELHDSRIDKRPFSWICFDVNPKTKKVIDIVVERSLKNFTYKEKMVEYLMRKLNCSNDTIVRNLNFKKYWFPIPLFIELLKLNHKLDISKLKWQINDYIRYLKTSGPTSVKVTALKNLTKEFCEVAGAHAADGTLPLRVNLIFHKKPLKETQNLLKQEYPHKKLNVLYDSSIKKHYISICLTENLISRIKEIAVKDTYFERIKVSYFFRIVDETKKSLEIIANNINKDFGLKYEPIKMPKVNAWYFTITNKIFIRYMIKYLKFKHGKKCYYVSIPKSIKYSNEEFVTSFVRGFIQFDGSVELDSRVTMEISSNEMIRDLVWYFNKNKLKFSYSKNPNKRGLYSLKLRKNQILDYLFFKDTLKYAILTKNFTFTPASKREAIDILNKVSNTNMKIKLGDFISYLKFEKTMKDLQLSTKISATSLNNYLNFLINCNIIVYRKIGKAYVYYQKGETQQWRLPVIE